MPTMVQARIRAMRGPVWDHNHLYFGGNHPTSGLANLSFDNITPFIYACHPQTNLDPLVVAPNLVIWSRHEAIAHTQLLGALA